MPGSPGSKAAPVIIARFHGLKAKIASTDSLLALADLRGMETSQGRELLKQANDEVVNARVALHSFDAAKIGAVLDAGTGYADKAESQAKGSLRDWRTRRLGMVAALGAILLLIALLMVAIRLRRAE